MAKYSKKHLLTEKSKDDAMKIARGTQKPGQTKEQTKLIAQGIQKGIDLYKKQQKAKSRELDRQRNKKSRDKSHLDPELQEPGAIRYRQHWLPWLLLAITWLAIVFYLVFFNIQN